MYTLKSHIKKLNGTDKVARIADGARIINMAFESVAVAA